jgi:hypothetical protein
VCPVCLSELREDESVRMLPCGHAHCVECTTRLVDRLGAKCSLCRSVAGALVLPYGLHTLPSAEDRRTCGESAVSVELLAADSGEYTGITVRDDVRGVRVVRTSPRDAGRRVLDVGTVITHVNGVPAVNHGLVVAVLDQATVHNMSIRLTTTVAATSSSRVSSWWRRFHRVVSMSQSSRTM